MPGLTSSALPVELTCLVVVTLAGVLWSWPKLARPGLARIAARVAALVTLQASLLGLGLVLVNRSYGFYSSWSDLLGRYRGGGAVITVDRAVGSPTALVSVLARSPVTVPGRMRPGGILETVSFRGRISGLGAVGHVYLPPGYGTGPNAHGPYPVVLVLTAPQTAPDSVYDPGRLAQATAGQILVGHLPPVIVVTLNVGPGPGHGCLDVPGGRQAGLFFTQDLPTALASRYPVQRQSSWAVIGDSTAGYCAFNLALTSAGVYAAAAAPAGTPAAPPGRAAWVPSPLIRMQDNLAWLMHNQPMQPVWVLSTGAGVPSYLARARPPMRVESTGALPGGRAALVPVLDWLGDVYATGARG